MLTRMLRKDLLRKKSITITLFIFLALGLMASEAMKIN